LAPIVAGHSSPTPDSPARLGPVVDMPRKVCMLKTMWAAYFSRSRVWSRKYPWLGRSVAVLVVLGAGTGSITAAGQTLQFPPPSAGPKPIEPATTPAVQPTAAQPIQPSVPVTVQRFAPAPAVQPRQVTPTTAKGSLPAPAAPTPVSSAAPPATLPPVGRKPLVAAWPPAVLPYQNDMPIPEGYRRDSHMNSGLTLGGITVWAVPYIVGLVAAAGSGFAKGSGWLALPIAGPFVAMGGRSVDCSVTDVTYNPGTTNLEEEQDKCRKSVIKEARVLALLTIDGLLQTTGAIMTVAGLLSPSEVLVRNDVFPLDGKVRFDAGYHQGQLRLQARIQF
jgi:hypothetical protein